MKSTVDSRDGQSPGVRLGKTIAYGSQVCQGDTTTTMKEVKVRIYNWAGASPGGYRDWKEMARGKKLCNKDALSCQEMSQRP